MKEALPHPRDGGVIVNVTSVLGKRAMLLPAPYGAAAKHGVVRFSEAPR